MTPDDYRLRTVSLYPSISLHVSKTLYIVFAAESMVLGSFMFGLPAIHPAVDDRTRKRKAHYHFALQSPRAGVVVRGRQRSLLHRISRQ